MRARGRALQPSTVVEALCAAAIGASMALPWATLVTERRYELTTPIVDRTAAAVVIQLWAAFAVGAVLAARATPIPVTLPLLAILAYLAWAYAELDPGVIVEGEFVTSHQTDFHAGYALAVVAAAGFWLLHVPRELVARGRTRQSALAIALTALAALALLGYAHWFLTGLSGLA